MTDPSDYIDAISEEQDLPDISHNLSHQGSRAPMKKKSAILEQASSGRARLRNPQLADVGDEDISVNESSLSGVSLPQKAKRNRLKSSSRQKPANELMVQECSKSNLVDDLQLIDEEDIKPVAEPQIKKRKRERRGASKKPNVDDNLKARSAKVDEQVNSLWQQIEEDAKNTVLKEEENRAAKKEKRETSNKPKLVVRQAQDSEFAVANNYSNEEDHTMSLKELLAKSQAEKERKVMEHTTKTPDQHKSNKKPKSSARPIGDYLPNESTSTIVNSSKPNKTENSTATMFKQGRGLLSDDNIQRVPEFVSYAVARGAMLECSLIRNKSCLNRFFLDYDLQTKTGKQLISVKKMALRCQSTYHISLANGDFSEDSGAFLGKVQGNFTGSVWNVFVEVPQIGTEMAATIVYKHQAFCCLTKAREVEVYVKECNARYSLLQSTWLSEGKNLQELYGTQECRERGTIKKLVNKKPRYNHDTGAYSLNFHRESLIGSVKNMILVEEGTRNEGLLIVKQGDNNFDFDISYPFSPIVALGFAMTCFDFKLATQ